MQYSAQWREARRLIHQYFMESKAESYVDLVDAEAVQCLQDMCAQPEDFMLHPKRFSNSVIMSLGAICSLAGCIQEGQDVLTSRSVFGTRTPTVHTEHMTKLYHLMERWGLIME
ncbi:hypothetical protein LTS18_013451, partial [Coniosporium uncinatum]